MFRFFGPLLKKKQISLNITNTFEIIWKFSGFKDNKKKWVFEFNIYSIISTDINKF